MYHRCQRPNNRGPLPQQSTCHPEFSDAFPTKNGTWLVSKSSAVFVFKRFSVYFWVSSAFSSRSAAAASWGVAHSPYRALR